MRHILPAVFMLAASAALAGPPLGKAPPDKAPPPINKPAPPAPGPGGAPQPGQNPAARDARGLAEMARRTAALCDVVPLEVAPQGGIRPLSRQDFACVPWRTVVQWPERDGRRTLYADWPEARRNKLDLLYAEIMSEAPTLSVECPSRPVLTGYLSDRQAEDIYLVHVAHALAIEQQRRTPWRLWRLPRAELDVLLGPDAYVSRVRGRDGAVTGYALADQSRSTRGLDCDPRVGWRFLNGDAAGQPEVLIGTSEEETLERLSAWFSRNVGHGAYNYRELAERAHLADRLVRYAEHDPPHATSYWATMGCWNATETFLELARAANIPLLRTYRGDAPGRLLDHSGLAFRWTRADARLLQHADDIYAVDWIAFPVDAAGRALDGPAAERAFFETHWATPATLMAHGFDYRVAQVAPAPATADYPWSSEVGGWTIGNWGLTPDERAAGATANAYATAFTWKKAFAIGGYNAVLDYCYTRLNEDDANWRAFIASRGGDLSPPIDAPSVRARMQMIESAWGGCAAMLSRIEAATAYKMRP